MNFNGAHNVLLQCENTLLDCAIRSHSFHCFVISFSPVKKLVIFCKRLKTYTILWIRFVKTVVMGRPKTTGKSHNRNASTYTSKTVFKTKKDNSQKTLFSFLHSDRQSSSLLASSEGVFQLVITQCRVSYGKYFSSSLCFLLLILITL